MKKLLSIVLIFPTLMLFVLAPVSLAANEQSVGAVTVALTSAPSPSGETDGVIFTGDGTVTVADGQAVNSGSPGNGNTSAIANVPAADNNGTVQFAGSSAVTGTVGTSALNDLKVIRLDGGNGTTVSISGNTFSQNVLFNGAAGTTGTLSIGSGAGLTTESITATNNNTGILTSVGGVSAISGTVGTLANKLNTVNSGANGATTTFANDVFATTLNNTGTGTTHLQGDTTAAVVFANAAGTVDVAAGKSITGNVTTGGDGVGTLTALGAMTVNGSVGTTGGNKLAALNTATGTTTTIAGDLNATTTTVTGTGTLAMTTGGDLAGTTVNYTGAGTVTLSDGSNLTAAVTTSNNGQGTLTSSGTNVITGQVGTNANKLNTVNAGANGATTTFANDVFATTLNNTGTGTTHLQGDTTAAVVFANAAGTVDVAAGKSITGAVTTGGAGVGTLTFLGATTTGGNIGAAGNALAAVNFNAGSTTLGHNIVATTTTLNNATTITASGSRTVTGDLTLAGTSTLDVGTTTLTNTGTFTMGAGTTLKTTIADATTFGKVSGATGSSISPTSTINVNMTGYVPSGSSFKIIDSAGAGAVSPQVVANTNGSAMLTFNASTVNGDTTLTAARTNLGATSNSSAVGAVITSINSPKGDMTAVLDQLDRMTSASDVDHALKQLTPVVDAGVTQGSITAMTQQVNSIGTHMEEFRNIISAGKSGISSGDDYTSTEYRISGPEEYRISGVWAKGFTNFGDQKDRQGIHGYDSSQWGMVIGLDGLDTGTFCLGVAGGYARSNIETKNILATTGIDSYQGTLYASYATEEPWYVEGTFSFGWNQYKGSRQIQFTGISRVADSSYAGLQYDGKIGGGYHFYHNNFVITPLASLEYLFLHLQEYSEINAGSLNLDVAEQNYNMLQSGFGVKLSYAYESEDQGTFIPEIHGKWLYDFIGDKQQTTSTFTGGGASFATNGFRPAQSSFDLGTGLSYISRNNVTLEAVYDMDVKSDFLGHSGTLVMHYSF